MLGKEDIALKVGRVVSRFKVAKHLRRTIEDGKFRWECREELIRQEAALGGISEVRSSESQETLSAAMPSGRYKSSAITWSAPSFVCCLKGMDTCIRPIYHRPKLGNGLDNMRKKLHIANAP